MTNPSSVQSKGQQTFYFIGVTTAHSAIMRIFPRWMEALGRPGVTIQGVDLPLHAQKSAYRRVVEQIKQDPRALGGLVTTHKIALYHAAGDLFDYVDPPALLLGEVSCISKKSGKLEGHAKDPIAVGLCLKAMLGAGYFRRTQGQALIFGAGGAGTATLLYLASLHDPADRPPCIWMVDILPERVRRIEALLRQIECDTRVEVLRHSEARQNDALMARLPPGSLVINATGMGKDIPGSPITDEGIFPQAGIAWEYNYRGELNFLRQAQRQSQDRQLRVEDGWLYFLHGWTQVIAEVLHIEINRTLFEQLKRIADTTFANPGGNHER